MADFLKDQNAVIWISIPLDGETAARLQSLSDVCHATPTRIAASLLYDILKDDEEANLPTAIAAGSVSFN